MSNLFKIRLRQNAPLIVVLLVALAACATHPPTAAISVPAPTNTACSAFPRITFDRLLDTAQTIAEIKSYDAGRDALCGKGK